MSGHDTGANLGIAANQGKTGIEQIGGLVMAVTLFGIAGLGMVLITAYYEFIVKPKQLEQSR